MNLAKLFVAQRILVTRIEKEHSRSVGEDRLPKLILALQVELGELADECRGFKFWSNDQDPVIDVSSDCEKCEGNGYYLFWNLEPGIHKHVQCEICNGEGLIKEKPLITEYVDCLHFILSIGLEDAKRYGETYPIYYKFESTEAIKYESIIEQFNYSFSQISYFMDCTCQCEMGTETEVDEQYETIFRMFLGLGEMLGFTWEQIEAAYYEKNEINHKRQETGY